LEKFYPGQERTDQLRVASIVDPASLALPKKRCVAFSGARQIQIACTQNEYTSVGFLSSGL
jgi:hypothetical protein